MINRVIHHLKHEYIFINPCSECLVRPCCSEECKAHDDFHNDKINFFQRRLFALKMLEIAEENSIFYNLIHGRKTETREIRYTD